MVSISDITTIKYWQTLYKTMVRAKEEIPKEFIIVDTCFTSLANIGKYIHETSKNLNHIHKDSNDILSVIITLVNGVNYGETVLFMEWLLMT